MSCCCFIKNVILEVVLPLRKCINIRFNTANIQIIMQLYKNIVYFCV
nr:MAG TPA: hypothetical protein [Caudoviricetes sp.]